MNQLCQCGCGQVTYLAIKTNNAKGKIKGQPLSYIHGHNFRKPIDLKRCFNVEKTSKEKYLKVGEKKIEKYI